MIRYRQMSRPLGLSFQLQRLGGLIAIICTMQLAAWSKPEAGTLALPFDKMVLFEGANRGEIEERVVEGGKIEGGVAVFQQAGKPEILIPWEKVQAVLPLLPSEDREVSLENLCEAVKVLEFNRGEWPKRPELSDANLAKWRERIEAIQKREEDEKRKNLVIEEDKIHQAAQQKALEESTLKEAERNRKIDWAKEKVANYLGLSHRQEIKEALWGCEQLDQNDQIKIPNLEKALEYWKRCLALPEDVEMPGPLEGQKVEAVALVIDPSATGFLLTSMAQLLFFVPLLITLHGLTLVLDHLRQRAWVRAGLWLGIAVLAVTCFYGLFFSKNEEGMFLGGGCSIETRHAWVSLANVKSKGVTRFAETIETPFQKFLQELVGSIHNPDKGSAAWVPVLIGSSPGQEKPDVEIVIQVPHMRKFLPVRISFAIPSPNQEINLKVTRGKVGPFPIGADFGAWIWSQVAPAYLGVANGLGLEEGVKFILTNPDKLSISIPEVRAKLKPDSR